MTSIEDAKGMCEQQIVRNIGAYQSFSVLGIEIIVGGGMLTIVVSFVVDSIVGTYQMRAL